MPVAFLNNAATQDNYVDALTVSFQRPRRSFTLNTFNNAIFYRLAIVSTSVRDPAFEPNEHYLAPSNSNFTNAEEEGFPEDAQFAGVMVRSAVAGTPARITVM